MNAELEFVVEKNPLARSSARAHHILVCVDNATFVEGCLPHAIALANALSSTMTIAHVMQPQHEHAGHHIDALGWEIARQDARAHLERLESQTVELLGRPVVMRLEQGNPAERIVDLTRELCVDLTVLGSCGERGWLSRNRGTTTQQVVGAARGSIFVASRVPSPSPAENSVMKPKRILVPLDGSPRTESVLPTAARIARTHDAELILVHIVQDPVATSVLRDASDLQLAELLASHLEGSAKLYLDGLCTGLAREATNVRSMVVRRTTQCQAILEIARTEHADLIVVSAHGAGCDPSQSFGTVTEYLLSHSIIPLLALQDLPDRTRATSEFGADLAPTMRGSHAPEFA